EPQFVWILGCLFCRRQRILITRQPVVQRRGSPLGERQAHSLATRGEVLCAGLDQPRGIWFATAKRRQRQCSVGDDSVVCCFGDGRRLINQLGGCPRCAGEQMDRGAGAEGQGQHGQRARFASEVYLAGGERVPAVVVPDVCGGAPRQPQPAQALLGADLLAA